MIYGIGIDVVRIERMVHWLEKPGLLERFFHPGELDDVRGNGVGKPESLAARFAAKEAFAKALGTGLRSMALREIEVRKDEQGKPMLVLHGRAASALRTRGVVGVHLSLSHERDIAVAQVILEV